MIIELIEDNLFSSKMLLVLKYIFIIYIVTPHSPEL